VESANGAAPARLTLARFHAPQTCGSPSLVTQLVLAFPAGGAGARSPPPSHVTVVALLDEIADVAPRDSRANAVDVATRRLIAAQPLALRCP